MKIIIIPHLPTLYGRRYNIAKTLAQQGNDVHFIVWDMPYPLTLRSAAKHLLYCYRSDKYSHSGFTVHKVRRLPFFWPKVNGYLFKRQIRSIYSDNSIDIVLSQSYTNETEPPAELPLVYDMNDDHAAYADIYGSHMYKLGFKALEVKKIVKAQAERAKLVTYVSSALGKMAESLNDHSLFLPNGVDEIAFTLPLKNKTAKKISLTYVSNFGPWSKLDLVIRAVDILKRSYSDIQLNVVGIGTELAKAKDITKSLNLNQNIRFYGHVSDRKKIFSIIDNSDLCINISEKNAFRDAAFPIKVIEYSARGKKVISSDLDEVRLLNLENVFICETIASAEMLANDIQSALNLVFDSSLISKKIASQYQWDTITRRLQSEINSIIALGKIQ